MDELYRRRIRSFANGLNRAKEIIDEKKPNILLAPMRGAIPLVDGINVADPYFDNSIVYYIPASTSIRDVIKVIAKTFANILGSLLDYEIISTMDRNFLILSMDEVVSGNLL